MPHLPHKQTKSLPSHTQFQPIKDETVCIEMEMKSSLVEPIRHDVVDNAIEMNSFTNNLCTSSTRKDGTDLLAVDDLVDGLVNSACRKNDVEDRLSQTDSAIDILLDDKKCAEERLSQTDSALDGMLDDLQATQARQPSFDWMLEDLQATQQGGKVCTN